MSTDTDVMHDLTIGPSKLKLPIYSSLVSAANNWSDGKFSIGDVTAVADVPLSILNTALDPLGAILKSAVEYLLDLLLKTIKPLGDAVDFLLGNPDAIFDHAHKWQDTASDIADLGNQHAATVTGTAQWKSPGGDNYRAAQRAVNDAYQAATGAASNMAKWVTVVGSGVAMFRELMWGMLVDFVTEALKAAILALAAAIPSAGTSVGAFTGWFSAKASIIAGKFSSKLAKLMQWCSKVAKKLGFSGKAFDRAAEALQKAAHGFGQNAARTIASGRTSYTTPGGKPTQIPVKPKLPGDTKDGLKDAVPGFDKWKDRYDNVKKYGQKPVDDALNKGTGREGTPKVTDI